MKRAATLPRSLVLAAAVLCSALLSGAAASAQPSGSDRATAQALFDEARRLMKAGSFGEACPKLAESHRLDPAAGTLFNLADCYEHVGRTATAWTMFLDVAALMKTGGKSEHEKKARERAAALEPKLTKLSIAVRAPAEGIEVLRDGVAIGSALWGTAVPVDPGSHTVSARASGRKAWETTVDVQGAGRTTEVAVPELSPLPPEPPPPVTATASASAAPAPTPLPSSPPTAAPSAAPTAAPTVAPVSAGPGAQRVLGIVSVSLGTLVLGLGTAAGILSIDNHDKAQKTCFDDLCDRPGASARQEAYELGNWSTGMLVAGGVLAAGGILLITTSPSAPGHAPSGVWVAPRALAGGGGLHVEGRF